MTAAEFEARIVAWAETRRDVAALVLGGSRARAGDGADDRSDWDFHLMSDTPEVFHGTAWLGEIAPCWCAHTGVTPRGVVKVSAVFAEGWEADFVPLATWQMKLVYAAMRRPGWAAWMPVRLRKGIVETRAFMLGSGYRVVKGGREWEERLEALQADWPMARMSAEQFAVHVSAFWPQAVWLTKRIARGETRAAVLWQAKLLLEHVYPVLAEEARLAGRVTRPEARKAEQWLSPERMRQTDGFAGGEVRSQAAALRRTIEVFQSAVEAVAKARGFSVPRHDEVAQWLRGELERMASAPRAEG